MPITDIVILALIIFSFVAFAVVLAWGDHQTRDIAKASRARALAGVGSPPTVPEAKPDVVVRNIADKKPAREPVHA